MELAALGSGSVLRDADVVTSREQARQARLRRLLVVLLVVGVPVIGRSAAGVVRYLQGNYLAAAGDFHWPHPGIPASLLPYFPGLLLHRPPRCGHGGTSANGRPVAARAVPARGDRHNAGRCGRHRRRGGRGREDAQPLPGPPHLSRSAWAGPRAGPSSSRARPGPARPTSPRRWPPRPACPFLFVSSSAFQSMYYGQTNRKIRSYFRALRNYARREGGAIGFIEEIDAIGATRGRPGRRAGPRGHRRRSQRVAHPAAVFRRRLRSGRGP